MRTMRNRQVVCEFFPGSSRGAEFWVDRGLRDLFLCRGMQEDNWVIPPLECFCAVGHNGPPSNGRDTIAPTGLNEMTFEIRKSLLTGGTARKNACDLVKRTPSLLTDPFGTGITQYIRKERETHA